MMYTLNDIKTLLRQQPFPLNNEKTTQEAIYKYLSEKEVHVKKEVWLDKEGENIIDFMVGNIGIEVKLKGQKRKIYEQIERYCTFDQVICILLVTNISMKLPIVILNKATDILRLGDAWL